METEVWSRIIGEDLGLGYVQLTADMLNMDLPANIISKYVKEINFYKNKYKFDIISTFTGAFTRVNHLAHPDLEIQKHWISWFKKFVDVSCDLNTLSLGSHFGIFTDSDNRSSTKRAERRKQNIENWHIIAEYAKTKGLSYLTWEPMSISREQGETIAETKLLQADVNKDSPLPFYLCLDVDHGDVTSPNPDDTDAYSWLKSFADESPLIHLKQSSKNKSGHWPFTQEYNNCGKIIPQKIVNTIGQNSKNIKDHYLLLELSFREREPIDSNVIATLKESVGFWREQIKE